MFNVKYELSLSLSLSLYLCLCVDMYVRVCDMHAGVRPSMYGRPYTRADTPTHTGSIIWQ